MAVRKAGTQKALATFFGVSQSAISEWGRARPIPRHVRPRLQEYVGLRRIDRAEPVGRGQELLTGHRDLLEQISEMLRAEMSGDVGKLPPRYRERYRERMREIEGRITGEVRLKLGEIVADVQRELEDFRSRLVAEYRAQRRSSP